MTCKDQLYAVRAFTIAKCNNQKYLQIGLGKNLLPSLKVYAFLKEYNFITLGVIIKNRI